MPKLASFKPSECFWGERIQPNDITWNFEKFIVAPNGVPIFRLSQRVWPEDMHDLLSALMSPGISHVLAMHCLVQSLNT